MIAQMNTEHWIAAALILAISVPAFFAGWGRGYAAGWLDRAKQEERGLRRLADDLKNDREW